MYIGEKKKIGRLIVSIQQEFNYIVVILVFIELKLNMYATRKTNNVLN